MSAWFSVTRGGPLRANKLFQLIFLAPFIGCRVSSSQLVLQMSVRQEASGTTRKVDSERKYLKG